MNFWFFIFNDLSSNVFVVPIENELEVEVFFFGLLKFKLFLSFKFL